MYLDKSLCNISSYFYGRMYLYCIFLLGRIKMNQIYTSKEQIILLKEICEVHYSIKESILY